ncbi:LysE family translocator [Colwellia sp. 1_MG-2023]|jgi:threonine/homoserine/homoserine lactone efflux protein|uniref:LysE family translocator n=1 Tax=unclassified Colwellia TaxID=196834 RepID=UPI001C080AA0|nr:MULTISPECIES: LysE family translocator [unclassified Colwellia]MBU2924301.1 LysE family translocator [Colwellia sp. C2M11]MDO6650897.1 LysE family translocator [Colwellia sp. 3_MG-2023]MDO6663932.1 LysE family translocator [Colwellia sp. 2_MG-2023]MDO6688283.1 LysE family translocator [Colwellia sp. 1_MG-2023]
MSYLEQFFIVAAVHLLAVASPGPDFAIILKQSIRYDRRIAIFTSLGIGTGILLHVIYSLVGVGVIIASDERLFTALKYIAASYFCYIAWHGLRAKKPLNTVNDVNVSMLSDEKKPSAKNAFFTGFLINGLNVKATLFFVSVYSVVISPETPFSIKLGYGLYMAIATAIWFVFLSYLLTHHKMRNFLQIKGYLIDRLMGLVLLLLAIQIVASDLS